MKTLLKMMLPLAALMLVGCSSGGDASEKKLEGKVEVKDAPAGATAPGDSRKNPADEGGRDGG